MPAFTVLGWLDVFDLAASLPKYMGKFNGEGRRTIYNASIDRWPELESVNDRLRTAGASLSQEIDKSILEMLDPGHCSPWRKAESALRTHLVVRTNPSAVIYSGTEAMAPGQGMLVAFSPQIPFSAINLGDSPRVHLVVDWRPKHTQGQERNHAPAASATGP